MYMIYPILRFYRINPERKCFTRKIKNSINSIQYFFLKDFLRDALASSIKLFWHKLNSAICLFSTIAAFENQGWQQLQYNSSETDSFIL